MVNIGGLWCQFLYEFVDRTGSFCRVYKEPQTGTILCRWEKKNHASQSCPTA